MNRTDSFARTRPTSPIDCLPTGVPELDAVLGGGIPDLSLNLIAGGPGSGKTTLAMQILFANATAERPGLYFTVLGEPTLKMLRYQQRYSFFDVGRVGSAVHLLNLSGEAMPGALDDVLARITAEVERYRPGIVVVDSFRTLGPQVLYGGPDPIAASALEHFVQRLALQLTTWETTSFLISEYAEDEQRHPVFTVADGIIWVSQVADRNSIVRKLQIVKVRGQEFMPGLHTYRITRDGLRVYPRIPEHQTHRRPSASVGDAPPRRVRTGVPGLDEMLGGGIQAGNAVMLAGATGTGKTTFATQFIAQGHRDAEPTVIAVFEEYPEGYINRAKALGIDLAAMVDEGTLRIIYLRPLDLSVDETLAAIVEAVEAIHATRVVIDSISGFEVALAPAFREDFRESFYRLVGALTAIGVTVLMTTEIAGPLGDASFTGERVSFLTDDIIVQRRIELDGRLRTVLAIVKMRGSEHSHDVREYTIGPNGAVIGEQIRGFRGLLTGSPEPNAGPSGVAGGWLPYVGLTGPEVAVLDALVRLREASAKALATRSGAAPEVVERALDRLITLDYAVALGDGTDEATYRATARASGP